MSANIVLDHKFRQMEGTVCCDIDGETVVLHSKNCKYFNLGAIGGDIWTLLEKEISVRQLVQAIESEYDVESRECELKVISFLGQLVDEQLIQIVDNQ